MYVWVSSSDRACHRQTKRWGNGIVTDICQRTRQPWPTKSGEMQQPSVLGHRLPSTVNAERREYVSAFPTSPLLCLHRSLEEISFENDHNIFDTLGPASDGGSFGCKDESCELPMQVLSESALFSDKHYAPDVCARGDDDTPI